MAIFGISEEPLSPNATMLDTVKLKRSFPADGNRRMARVDELGLAGWEGLDLMSAVALLMSHPSLGAAVRDLARRTMTLIAADRALGSLMKDAGRYVAAMMSFQLDATGGLTLGRLKAACERSGLLSPGRARSLLQFSQHLGYVERQPGSGPGTIYALTPAFRAAWGAQLRMALEAAAVVEPKVGRLLEPGREDVVWTFGRLHAEDLLRSTVEAPPVLSFATAFLHPLAGVHVALSLIAESDTFPPRTAGPISISGLARRFDVSRPHVTRIFEGAARQDVARLAADGMLSFTETAREEMRWLYAAQLACILTSAGKAARVHGLTPEPVAA